MAKKFLTHIDLNKNELRNAVIQPLASAPSSPVEGQIYYDTGNHVDYIYTNGGWLARNAAGSGVTNLAATLSATNTIVTSDTGTDATIPAVDGTNAGVMTPTQNTKLNGIASGATANDTDANLKARANHTGTQTASTISDFSTAADARITAAAGVSVASLSGGLVPTSQLPAISLTSVQTAASQTAQLALTTQEGDVVVRTDTNTTYMRNAGTAGTMADFTLLNTPTDAVTSVAGRTGVVVLAKADVGLSNVDNTSDASKPVSTAQAAANALKLAIASNLSDINNAATAFSNIKQAATTTATGVSELATAAVAEARTDTVRAVTPVSLANFPVKKIFTVGDAIATSITLTHNLGTSDVITQLRQASDNVVVEADITNATINTVTLTFATAPASNAIKAIVMG